MKQDNGIYKKELEALKAKYGSLSADSISESYLSAQAYTANNTGIYQLSFDISKGNRLDTERLLDDNDAFRAVGLRFYLGIQDTTNPAAMVKQTYVNRFIFEDETGLAAPGNTFNPLHLESVYSFGFVSYKKGVTEYLPALSLIDTRHVPITQQTSATNQSATDNTPGILLKQPFTIMGADRGVLTVNIPAAGTLSLQYAHASHANKKVTMFVELFGWLIKGGSKNKTAADL